jgi:WD40 repeat protein
VHELAFSRDSRLIAVRIHSIIEVWDTEAGDLLAFFCGSPDQYFQSITVSSDLKLVAAGDLNGGITFWSFMEQDKNDIVTSSHRDCVHSVAFSPDSKFLASASRDRTIKIWNTATLVCLKSLEGHRGDVNSVVFTPDGKLLISASDDMTIRVWGTELPT